MMTQEKTTALIWLNYPKAGWLWVKDDQPIALYNHIHDYVNNIKIADEDTNPQAWERILRHWDEALQYMWAGALRTTTTNTTPTRSSANISPNPPSPPEDIHSGLVTLPSSKGPHLGSLHPFLRQDITQQEQYSGSYASINSNLPFPDKLPDPPVEELSLIQAFAYPDPPVTYVNNPSDTDKPELFPDEDLRISEALAYGYHTTNIKGNPQSTVTTAGGPVEVRKEYGRSKVNIGILE